MGFTILSDEDALAVKSKIWNAIKNSEVADLFMVSESLISQILTGKRYHDIAWPDGTSGALPHWRRLEIHRMKFKGHRERTARLIAPTVVERASEIIDQEMTRQVEAGIDEVIRLGRLTDEEYAAEEADRNFKEAQEHDRDAELNERAALAQAQKTAKKGAKK